MPSSHEIRLVVNRAGEVYEARWVEPDGQESTPFALALPLKREALAELRWYLETYLQFPGAGDHARARGSEARFDTWGHALFDAIFGSVDGTHVLRNLEAAEAKGKRCQITIGATDPKLLAQPWEMLRDKRGPLVFRGVTIRRQLQGSRHTPDHRLKLPLRVLLIVSRPADMSFIDPRTSVVPVLDALDALPPGHVMVEFCEPPTMARLEERISVARKAKRPYHLLHFDGHGTYLPQAGVGELAFEDEQAKTDLISGKRLGDLLARLKVPIVLLEACRGSDLSDQPIFGSVAPALLQSGVGSVVAFSHSVHVRAAQLLVERFYQELAEGRTVGQALEEARTRLYADRRRWLHLGPDAESVELEDWFIPQLYQVGKDLSLGRASKSAPAPEATPQTSIETQMHGFPPEPLYKFKGRALEIHALERAFRRHPAVLLSGMGGMGKSALSREAAHWGLRKKHFEAAIFCSFEQRAGAERVVQMLGKALEGDGFATLSSEAQWVRAVELFHERRVLLIWDNFESTLPIYQAGEESLLSFGPEARDQLHRLYRELTAGNPDGRLLVTCRPEKTGLPAIKEMPLQGLARPDSLYLLAAILDKKSISRERRGYEREEIDDLLTLLQDYPLCIELVAPHLKTLTPKQIRDEFRQLLARFTDDALEGHNRSLLASLEFSRKRLSPAAQQILPYLAWFQGGVFERFLLDFIQVEPVAWDPLRAEFVDTALLKVEHLPDVNTPYLRFHPTLPCAARPEEVPDPDEAGQRFLAIYLGVRSLARNAMQYRQPAKGMALVAYEEGNLRAAMQCALQRGEHWAAWALAETLQKFLERAGRLRERDTLVQWLHQKLPDQERLDVAICSNICDYAWTLFAQGHTSEAVQLVKNLVTRLEHEGLAGGGDMALQIALSYGHLGRIFRAAGRPDLALKPLELAVTGFESLGDVERDNLAAALGESADTYLRLGQFEQALTMAEQSLAIERVLGRDRSITIGLCRAAAILVKQQRYAEAEARYDEALQAARVAEDLELQGIILQYQGELYLRQGHYERTIILCKQAIIFFQRSEALGDEMRTYNLLAATEEERNQLDAAEAWYAHSQELAGQLNDKYQLAVIAQNIGFLYQKRAEQTNEPSVRAILLHQAIDSVKESLAIMLDMQNQVEAAASYYQLGTLHRMLEGFEEAEQYALQALQIYEPLNHPNVYIVYGELANIARTQGDKVTAAQWQTKHDAKLAELQRLHRGEGTAQQRPPQVSEEARQYIFDLAQAVYHARRGVPLRAEVAEALTHLAQQPAPWDGVGTFLHVFARGEAAPPVPAHLPREIAEILAALVAAG